MSGYQRVLDITYNNIISVTNCIVHVYLMIVVKLVMTLILNYACLMSVFPDTHLYVNTIII